MNLLNIFKPKKKPFIESSERFKGLRRFTNGLNPLTFYKKTQKAGFRWSDFIAEKIIKSVSFLSFAVIILIFVFVFRETLPVFYSDSRNGKENVISEPLPEMETYGEEPALGEQGNVSEGNTANKVETSGSEGKANWESLTNKDWVPVSEKPKYGLLPLFWGSFKVTMIAVLIATPLAILAALFSAVFAPPRVKEVIKPVIELLAGFPSVVIGFFALMTVASFLQSIFGHQFRLNAFVGGAALSLAVIPIIYTVTEDAIASLPKYMTEASFALGATKWQTALFVIMPAATPGIFAAMLLGIGRAFGETMIVLMATGNAALLTFDVFDSVRTMSATIGAEMAEVVFGDTHYYVLFLIGTLLFVFTFTLNAIAEFYVRNKLMKRFKGE